MTLDHSHVIFKMDNPAEQDVQDMRADVEAGRVVLDPFKPGNVCSRWIDANYVRHAHACAAVPNGPPNISQSSTASRAAASRRRSSSPSRASGRDVLARAGSRAVEGSVRQLMRHHATAPQPELGDSTEFTPGPTMAAAPNTRCSENVAYARWLRETWEATLAEVEGRA